MIIRWPSGSVRVSRRPDELGGRASESEQEAATALLALRQLLSEQQATKQGGGNDVHNSDLHPFATTHEISESGIVEALAIFLSPLHSKKPRRHAGGTCRLPPRGRS